MRALIGSAAFPLQKKRPFLSVCVWLLKLLLLVTAVTTLCSICCWSFSQFPAEAALRIIHPCIVRFPLLQKPAAALGVIKEVRVPFVVLNSTLSKLLFVLFWWRLFFEEKFLISFATFSLNTPTHLLKT